MTKEDALALLDEYVEFFPIPEHDVVVLKNEYSEWTFKGLLKIAYNLKDND